MIFKTERVGVFVLVLEMDGSRWFDRPATSGISSSPLTFSKTPGLGDGGGRAVSSLEWGDLGRAALPEKPQTKVDHADYHQRNGKEQRGRQ